MGQSSGWLQLQDVPTSSKARPLPPVMQDDVGVHSLPQLSPLEMRRLPIHPLPERVPMPPTEVLVWVGLNFFSLLLGCCRTFTPLVSKNFVKGG